jgi:glycosyltransferase involved in cell wall biosynthesis
MKVSIITVCRNSSGTIAETLRSVAAQSRVEIEHIIIDGGSTDDTMKIVRLHRASVAHAVSEPDRGIYDAMNKGLALATGDIVGFLNSDDVYADVRVLEDIVEAARVAGPTCGFVYGDIVMVDERNRVVRHWKTGVLESDRLEGCQIPHPAFFVRRELLNSVKPAFDPTLRIAADLKQQLILINKLGIRGTYLSRPLVKMRLGGTSTASIGSYVAGWKESARAYNDVFGRGGYWFTGLKVLSKLRGLRRLG